MGKFDFKQAAPVKKIEVKIPEWDPEEKFFLEELRADVCMKLVDQVNKLQEAGTIGTEGVAMYAEMLAQCLTNEAGERPTKDWLMQASFATLQRVGAEALKLNGFDSASQAAAAKN
jgi:hypothetical protein